KTLSQLDKLMVAGDDAKMLAEVKEKRSNFISARNKMVDTYASGQRDAALAMFHSTVVTTVGAYQKALGEVRDYQQQHIAKSSGGALASVDDSRRAIALGSAIALVIAVFVGFLSTRSVARPIGT